ncbi:MAG: hypothetical protein QM820_29915 [Minicystis sp.]
MSAGRGIHPTVWITVLVMGGYFLIARLVDNLYPFSTFPMYAGAKGASASHIVARDGAGKLHNVFEYEGWSCPEPLDVDPPKCRAGGHFGSIEYIDRAIVQHLQKPRLPGGPEGEPIDLVRHIWRFREGSGDVRTEDCVIEHCRAVRR